MILVRSLLLALVFAAGLCGGAHAQGCGPANPNCVVPTPPAGDSSSRAAPTAFVQGAIANIAFPVTISTGTLPTGINALNVLATLPNLSGAQVGFNLNTQTTAGTNPSIMAAMNVTLGAGYTGSGDAIGILFTINTASTANIASGAGAPHGNSATQATASGTGTGANFGHTGTAKNGNMNVGTAGYAFFAKNSATNIGVLGDALNTGTTPVQIAGLFTLHGSVPAVSAALIADNAATSSPIFLGMIAGVTTMELYASGGLALGTSIPADPGANNFTAAGTIRANSGFSANGSAGVSTTCTVTAANTYVFTNGLLTTKGANCT